MAALEDLRIGFVGFGNMGSGIAEGMLSSGRINPMQLYACGAHFEKCQKRCDELGGMMAMKTPEEVADQSELVFLCVKPNLVKNVLASLAPHLAGKIVVSIVWGLDFENLALLLPSDTQILCTCPNTPVSIGKGLFIVERANNLEEKTMSMVTELLSTMSRVVTVETAQMNSAGVLASCGSAFADLFLEALGDAGVLYGLPRQTAYALAAGMMEGTAALQAATRQHPGAMKDAVCSPGGATIKGVAKLEEKGFRSAVIEAVRAIQG